VELASRDGLERTDSAFEALGIGTLRRIRMMWSSMAPLIPCRFWVAACPRSPPG